MYLSKNPSSTNNEQDRAKQSNTEYALHKI
jgi:hypothetical protein